MKNALNLLMLCFGILAPCSIIAMEKKKSFDLKDYIINHTNVCQNGMKYEIKKSDGTPLFICIFLLLIFA